MIFLVHLTYIDVTGAVGTSDRHLRTIAMRVTLLFLTFCKLSFVLCALSVQFGSLAIATTSTRDSFDCEGPLIVYNRSCRLRPTITESEICRK